MGCAIRRVPVAQDVGGDHGRRDVAMAELRGVGVPEAVAGDSGKANSLCRVELGRGQAV